MSRVEILNLVTISQNFPQLDSPAIPRDNLLDTLDAILASNADAVVVEGQDGIGKTTLLAQFVLRYPERAISLFLRPASRWGYDPPMVRLDLYSQLYWILNKRETSDIEVPDDATLRTAIYSAQRRAARESSPYFLVVDGLNEIPREDFDLIKDIMQVLPIGQQGFRCILSGGDQISAYLGPRVKRKEYPLAGFTLDETSRFLSDVPLERSFIHEFHKLSRGVPGILASIKRLLRQGANLDELLETIPSKLPDLFDLEWKVIQNGVGLEAKALALLAFDKRARSVSDIAEILGMDSDALLAKLRAMQFLEIGENGHVTYISESFRVFAARKLASLKRECHELLIDYLLRRPETPDALSSLSDHFEQAGRLDDLVDYLSPENFLLLIQETESLHLAKQKASQGLRAAHSLKRDGDLMRFALQRSVVSELPGATFLRSEVEARMAIRDFPSALALAQTALVREDRLHLLCVYARVSRLQGLEPDEAILDQIKHLLAQIDPISLGEQAIDIAADLLFIIPEAAIDLIERTTRTENSENSLDQALASLSLAAVSLGGSNLTTSPHLQVAELIQERVKNPSTRNLLAAVTMFVGDFSAAEVIQQVEKLSRTADKVRFLSKWLTANRRKQDCPKVIEYAFSIIIFNAAYSPNASVIRDLALPLPYLERETDIRHLIGVFDGQRGTLEKTGPTTDLIDLQLVLASACSRIDFEGACSRILDVYFRIAEMESPVTKLTCLARLLAGLEEVDPEGVFENREGLRAIAEDELFTGIGKLLNETADQYTATKNILVSLVPARMDIANKLVDQLNREGSRNRARLTLVESIAELPPNNSNLRQALAFAEASSDYIIRDNALLEMLLALSEEERLPEDIDSDFRHLVNSIQDMSRAADRAYACCLAITCCRRMGKADAKHVEDGLLQQLESSWKCIERTWDKIDVGFKIVKVLAEVAPDIADSVLAETNSFRKEIGLETGATVSGLLACIRLSLKAFGGLLPSRLDTESDLERITNIIDRVPAAGERALLLADLALRFFQHRRFAECGQVVTERLKPIIYNLSRLDSGYRNSIICLVAPALYAAHKSTCLDEIRVLPRLDCDEACGNICKLILTKLPPWEPYEFREDSVFDLTFEEIVDICEVLELVGLDNLIWATVSNIVNSILAKRARDRYTQQQIAEVARRLKSIIDAKLPDLLNIRHNGYSVISRAALARLRKAPATEWASLAEEARNLPNPADSVLCLMEIGVALPGKDRDLTRKLLQEGVQRISALPSIFDRVDRLEQAATLAMGHDPSFSRRCLRAAMQEALTLDEKNVSTRTRRIIDTAYSLDPELAASLASLADDDPARKIVQREIREQLKLLDMKNKMLSAVDIASESKRQYYASEMSWKMLRSLNSSRTTPLQMSKVRDYLKESVSSELSISEGHAFFSWIIENINRTYSNTPEARNYIRSIFEAGLLNAELSARITLGMSPRIKSLRHTDSDESKSQSVVVRAGERSYAITFIREWLKNSLGLYLKICDAYFGPEDLECLQMVLEVNSLCKVSILTSRKHQADQSLIQLEEAYRLFWNKLSDQEPPPTEIVVVGLEDTGQSPVHDRWWLSESGGLRLGTSFNSLGRQRDSDISILTRLEAEMREREIDQYLERTKREHRQKRLRYTLFNL